MKSSITTVAAIFAFFVLYSPQPLLPLFAAEYGVSVASAGALMTATLIPLALAPLVYGYVLSTLSPSILLKCSLAAMGVSCIAFAISHSYESSFAIRLIQGLLLPAALTAITTHISITSSAEELQKNMSLFITGTILGGLAGRILAGLFASYWSWELFYYCLAIAIIITAVIIPTNTPMGHTKKGGLRLHAVSTAFRTPGVGKIYCSIFCLFFSFVAILNYLPFIVKSMMTNVSEVFIGLMYCGFTMGVITSLGARRFIHFIGSRKQTMIMGFIGFIIALTLLFVKSIPITFMLLFLVCGSMFLTHSVAATEVNRRSSEHKSIVNALYVTFYYGGGVAGSYIPGIIFQHYGQTALLISLLVVTGTGLITLSTLHDDEQCD